MEISKFSVLVELFFKNSLSVVLKTKQSTLIYTLDALRWTVEVFQLDRKAKTATHKKYVVSAPSLYEHLVGPL